MDSEPRVQIEVVQSPRAYHDFVELPWQVPLGRPIVRPMREFQRHLFDHGRFRGKFSLSALIDNALLGKENPYYEHGELEMFLARDPSGKPIARVAALHNRLHNDYHNDSVGFFGFYECTDGGALGRAATSALLDQASEWLRQRNLTSIRGPFNPTINDDCGVWLPGPHDDYPSFMMPSNAAYYADHLQAAGMTVVKTMRVYRVDLDHFTGEWERWGKMIQRLGRSAGITMRGANFKDLDSEVKTFLGIYNSALANNWGYAPMSFKELRSMAELFQSLVDPNLIRAAEVVENGQRKVVGATITIPDLNEILRDTGGRLGSPEAVLEDFPDEAGGFHEAHPGRLPGGPAGVSSHRGLGCPALRYHAPGQRVWREGSRGVLDSRRQPSHGPATGRPRLQDHGQLRHLRTSDSLIVRGSEGEVAHAPHAHL